MSLRANFRQRQLTWSIWAAQKLLSDPALNKSLAWSWKLLALAGPVAGVVCPFSAVIIGIVGRESELLSKGERTGAVVLSVAVLAWTIAFLVVGLGIAMAY